MIEWSQQELNSCTAYGILWLVVRIEHGVMLCHRVRKKKGLLYISKEDKLFQHMSTVSRGELLFQDKGGKVARLMPEGVFKEKIDEALRCL